MFPPFFLVKMLPRDWSAPRFGSGEVCGDQVCLLAKCLFSPDFQMKLSSMSYSEWKSRRSKVGGPSNLFSSSQV